MGFCFGAFEVDPQLFELRENGTPVRIDRKVFDLLCYLCAHQDRVVDKAELLEHVWAGDTVVEAVIPTAITRLRKTLRQDSNVTGPIQTVHGRGYRFVEPLQQSATVVKTPRPIAPPSPDNVDHGLRSSVPFDTDVRPSLRDPFVGREVVMERLTATLERALGGELRGRLLVGEPGIGKTRITTELGNLARKRGARVWSGRCPPLETPVALWPWHQIARQCGRELSALRTLSNAQRMALVPLMPELASDATRSSAPPALDAAHATLPDAQARLALFDAVCALLRACAAQAPVVLVLDDLHWADEESLALLEHVLIDLGDAALLILGTYRDAELPKLHPHAALLDRFERVPAWKRIALASFDVDDVVRYVSEMTGDAAPLALARRIHERTGGNPFFVRETVRTLSDRTLSGTRSSYSEVELPGPARDVIRRRVAALPESAQRLLEVASVLEAELELDVLASACEVAPSTLLDAINRALSAQLLVVEGLQRYAFVHVLVRDTVYGDLSSRARQALHLRAAETLRARDEARYRARIEQHIASAGQA